MVPYRYYTMPPSMVTRLQNTVISNGTRIFSHKKCANCLSYIILLRQMHLGLKINDHYCQYDHIKNVRNYLLKLVNTKIVSRIQTVPAWLFEDFYPSFQATPEMLLLK